MKKSLNSKTLVAYLMIFFVVLLWGVSPPLNVVVNEKYSVAIRSVVIGLVSAITLLIICFKNLKKLNAQYFKYAVPTGLFIALASLVQKIGLLYTTPTKYAFLENISCVVVPIILFVVNKKKPSFLTALSSILCLIGCFVLSGLTFGSESLSFGKGEFLCALAGVLYGINIAYTGMKIKNFDTLLYLLIQQWVSVIVGIISTILFALIKVDGVPIEAVKFRWDIGWLLILVVMALVSNVLCWYLRTYSMKYVNPTAVSVIMPFSAVITGVVSVIFGMDVISLEFLLGGLISLVAVILSSIGDIKYEGKIVAKLNNDKQIK